MDQKNTNDGFDFKAANNGNKPLTIAAKIIPQHLIKCVIKYLFVSLCYRHTVGDTKVPFCLQSCVKPLKYSIAVHDHGTEYVHRFIGKEPSGLRFNKLFLNEDGEKRNSLTCHLYEPLLCFISRVFAS